jgi:uncharacterized protein YaaW (UPF0174 family)
MHGETFFSAVLGTSWQEALPLARLLEVTLSPEAERLEQGHCKALWKEISYLGSNDLAYLLRGLEGVDYPEIVRDVCAHLRIRQHRPGEDGRAVEHNEQLVIHHVFAGAWERLDEGERRELLREMNLDEAHLPLGGGAVAATVLAGKAGGFAVYKLSAVVANWVARALLGRGLALGANAALSRVLGVAAGPVGWVASGAWLLSDVTSPALRKTVPAVVLVACLRQAKHAALEATALADVDDLEEPVGPAASPRKSKRTAKKRRPTPTPTSKRKKVGARQPRSKKVAARKKTATRKKVAARKKADKPRKKVAARKQAGKPRKNTN